MRRPFYALLLVAGVALVVLGAYRLAFGRPVERPQFIIETPSQNAEALTPGTWIVYDQVGSGQYGTAAVLQVSVTAPDGSAVPVSAPAFSTTLHNNGVTYAESVTMRISTAGSYVVSLTPAAASQVLALVSKSVPSRFPWSGLIVDGAVLFDAWRRDDGSADGRRQVGTDLNAGIGIPRLNPSGRQQPRRPDWWRRPRAPCYNLWTQS